MRPFVHLHTHSHYSLLQALPQVGDLVKKAKADGQIALALTDIGNMYAALEFYKACKKQEIKPIIGVELAVAPRSRRDMEHNIDDHTFRIVILAKNITGYRNLLKLVSRSHLEGFYAGQARADRELLSEYHDGLIAILPTHRSEVSLALKDGDRTKAESALAWYRATFGEDVYIEITRHDEIEGSRKRADTLVALARDHQTPIVAAHDVYFMDPEDGIARDLVVAIGKGDKLERDFAGGYDFSFISQARANELFRDLPEALDNTVKIAESCDVELDLGKWVFPNFPIPEGKTFDEALYDKAYNGMKELGIECTPSVKERTDYELSVIAKKGYSPYFLVVSDLLNHAREVGIYTNTRGSAAGSFVSYLCGITTVNPLEYDLPFERFLNPERPSPPDIDMDIADNRRDDMIDYARSKYGDDHVAQIGTFGTMMARAAVRDTARALGYSYAVGDQIAKIIPPPKQGFPVTIASALNDVPELKEVYDSDPEARDILDLAQSIEGNARHVGVHAAGVVISPTPVTDFVPIQNDPKGGKAITQYDMHAVEEAGLLKYDFLGLKNLSILADAVSRVKNRLGVDIDMRKVPLTDEKTFAMLARGETLGVFQMAGGGMTAHLKELKPSTVNDLNAMVALYRPGPMAFIPAYIERKHNPRLISYLDPRMESILGKSYGIITYQDDVLMIAINLAGYSWLEADKFRKAIGKKIVAEMAAQKEKFTKGCIERGMKPEVVTKLWEQIETFAAYGFNKAHAASYGNLAYKTAYMKANFPVDYMAALLTADAGDVEKIAEIVGECKRMKIDVLPPSVNESMGDFAVTNETTIRFGLYSIKNFGVGVADSIIAARKEKGPFKDLADFLSRVPDKNLNKKQVESLIQSGAMDELGERGQMLTHIEMLLSFHKESASNNGLQDSLFGAMTTTSNLVLPPAQPTPFLQKLRWEKELLGLYVSGHPLDAHKDKFTNMKFDITATKEKLPPGIQTVIAGCVMVVRQILTKKGGEKMLFVQLEDMGGATEVVAFPRVVKDFGDMFTVGECILVKGRMTLRNTEKSFIAEAVKKL